MVCQNARGQVLIESLLALAAFLLMWTLTQKIYLDGRYHVQQNRFTEPTRKPQPMDKMRRCFFLGGDCIGYK